MNGSEIKIKVSPSLVAIGELALKLHHIMDTVNERQISFLFHCLILPSQKDTHLMLG